MGTMTAEPAGSRVQPRVSQPSRPEKEVLPARARPEDVFRLLHQFIEDGKIGKARRLTLEAERRFPDHARIRLAKRILNDGKATPSPVVEPTATAESEWLDNPPEQARGKWVALIGSELIAMADSMDELTGALKSKKLIQPPLVHHLAA